MSTSILDIGSVVPLLLSFGLALTLPPIQGFTSSPLSVPPIKKTFTGPAPSTLDSLTLISNVSLDAGGRAPVCNGSLLGFDMNRYSCLQAWTTIPVSSHPLTFGQRLSGAFDVPLPRRFSGPDGTCVIDIFHKDGVISDVTSYYQISSAAERLYGVCVAQGGTRTQGGWVRNLGQHKNLVVVLSIYEPAVSCFGERFATESTGRTLQDLLSMIPVNTDRQMFGPEGEPGVQVVVPIVFRSPDPSLWAPVLGLTIDVAHHDSVNARWFDIWAGAVAVSAICTIRGYPGIASLPNGLGVTLRAVLRSTLGNGTSSE